MTIGQADARLQAVIERLRAFVAAREWKKFHDPKNLAMGIASEAGELLSELRWVDGHNADRHVGSTEHRPKIENEVADVAIALLLFCDRTGIDLLSAIDRKITINEFNYPAPTSRGRAERPVTTGVARPSRVIAVDWSGEVSGGAKATWLAEVCDGHVIRLENGRTRNQVANELIRIVHEHPETVVGLDFAFSFPAWFVRHLGGADHTALWQAVGERGEKWLADCESPFWGRPGIKNPRAGEGFRSTEKGVGRLVGAHSKSVFQIGGAGTVGTGSIRGMPILLKLRDAGFAIWPFDKPVLPVVVEIYPRLLTGPVKKSDPIERDRYLSANFPELSATLRVQSINSEDAFDAIVSALVMWRSIDELPPNGQGSNSAAIIEGEIWVPSSVLISAQETRRGTRIPILF